VAADRLGGDLPGPMASLATETWLRFLVWLAVGLLVYFLYGRTHSRLAPGVSGRGTDEALGADSAS
jgi:APA family basic amino acid/polyamine antiporter